MNFTHSPVRGLQKKPDLWIKNVQKASHMGSLPKYLQPQDPPTTTAYTKFNPQLNCVHSDATNQRERTDVWTV